MDYSRPIELTIQGFPISRAQLALAIARIYGRFIEKFQYSPDCDRSWRMGVIGEGIALANVYLLHIFNIVDDVWMAEIAYDLPPPAHLSD
jgi:hypothetical protein